MVQLVSGAPISVSGTGEVVTSILFPVRGFGANSSYFQCSCVGGAPISGSGQKGKSASVLPAMGRQKIGSAAHAQSRDSTAHRQT